MSKSADNFAKTFDAPASTKRNSKYQIVFKESQRSHSGQLSMNRMYSLNRENILEVKSIHTEPAYDFDSQLKQSPVIFDRNHGIILTNSNQFQENNEKNSQNNVKNSENNVKNNEKIGKNSEKNQKNQKNNQKMMKINILELPSSENPLLKSSVASEKSSICNCLICCDKASNAVFLDCGHGGAFSSKNPYIFSFSAGFCYDCGLEILQKTEECHLCRKVIKKPLFWLIFTVFSQKIKQVLLLDLASKSKGVLKVAEGAKLVSCSELEKSVVSSQND